MMGYFKAIPKELEECARIDGARAWQAMVSTSSFRSRCRASCRPGFLPSRLSWNEFIYALVFLSSPGAEDGAGRRRIGTDRGDVFFWGPLMAGALLGSIPVAIVYSFFVEHYVSRA